MKYQLALKLKNAGFPKIRFTTFTAKGPTLSKLIEACGNELRLQSYWSENDLMWQADNSYNFSHVDNENFVAEIGSTPEEAVANLWLALNK